MWMYEKNEIKALEIIKKDVEYEEIALFSAHQLSARLSLGT